MTKWNKCLGPHLRTAAKYFPLNPSYGAMKFDDLLDLPVQVLELNGNETKGRCMTCPLWHQPTAENTSCVPCSTMCHCPERFVDLNGTCVDSSDIGSIANSPSFYTLNVQGKYFTSQYFRDHVQTVALKCKVSDRPNHISADVSMFTIIF